ncbi:SRPBCC family protein [Cellulomonas marina]|uniref:Polyketide cyclase / dehydrase and lipid transport n=1 Tax=Cellulomonas marina TaxID=988821 RepID=A0A1I0XJ64_9CELL|nr:SRPBCC family protein [Cellulomonas marina]GIG30092.1 hypothetical protein Cma02nite_26920 [Cellulomonas marina]SFB01052.1 Polyketide cyclase / dehydrase and lipid transport [Cellulomonas marina]
MTDDVRDLRVHVARPVAEVHAFASAPANLPRWAPGLGRAVRRDGDDWFVEQPDGWARVRFTAPDEVGVLDHDVLTASGDTVHVGLRAVPADGGCDVLFTLRRPPGASDEELERDAALVAADLERLRQVVESEDPSGA